MSCHTGAYPLRPSLLASLSGLSFGFGPFDRPFSYRFLSSLSRDCTYIDRSSSCQFRFVFLGPHLYRSVIIIIHFSLSLRGRTYIDRLSSYHCHFQFESGLHLYWSVIILSVWVYVFGTAPISTGHHLVSFVDRSFIMSVQFESRPHLYRSVIFLSAHFDV